jgi:hypothetical protein
MNKDELIDYIKNVTKPVEEIEDNFIGIFKWLSSEIYEGKAALKANSIQFIVAKILTRKGQTLDLRKREYFNIYVIGDFRKSFTPVIRVAEAFANFYIEMGVMPNIIPLPKSILLENKDLLNKLNNGVLLYERR